MIAVLPWLIALATSPLDARPSIYAATEFQAAVGRVSDLAFSNDGRLIAVAGARGYGVWDAQTGNSIRKAEAASRPYSAVAIGRDGIYLALGDTGGNVVAIDLRSGASRSVASHSRAISAVAFSADGRIGASGDVNGDILVWDPDQGPLAPLRDGGHRGEIVALGFVPDGGLVSVSKDLRVVAWDVSGKRPVRRTTLQTEVAGRTVVLSSAAIDLEATKLVVAAQAVSEPRGGMLTDRPGPARPGDLRRDNLLLSYVVGTGISPDPIRTGEYKPNQVALSPAGCFAFFTSEFRDTARLHVWGLLDQGDDLIREDLGGKAVAVALEPAGRLAAVAAEDGRVKTWRVSGATTTDCTTYRQKPTTTAAAPTPTVVAGPESEPLIQGSPGLRLAVMKFESTGLDPTLGDGVAEMVAGQLSNNRTITVVERAAIDAVLRELEIQRSGLTTADAVRIGRGLNARKVMLGSIRRFGEDTYVILSRLVDVETQQMEGSREVTCQHCKEQDLPKAVEALRRMLVR
ncbi:MAG: CsgG/HfaB family protein [Vicinamibacterales bacterium]